MRIIPQSYYQQTDTLWIAADLLGKVLCFQNPDGQIYRAVITETEAYLGAEDRASHAWGNRVTPRTQTMFQAGGIAYIYLCYGIHYLFNIVTHQQGIPHAILVRGGILNPALAQLKLNPTTDTDSILLDGPGKLTRKMGITTRHNGVSLNSNVLWIEDHNIHTGKTKTGPRVGIEYAGEDALLPYRFLLEDPFHS